MLSGCLKEFIIFAFTQETKIRNMLNIQNISLQRGNKLLLNNASFQLYPKMKVGLIGKNGCGKSSLFALIRGEILADKGEMAYPKHWKIASVKQETPSSNL